MKKISISLFSIFLLMNCAISSKNKTTIKINQQIIIAEIAKSDQDRATGLMNRETLKPNHGMLFILENSDFHGFWMKNTLIPLDIIWIDEHKKIVDIKSADPCVVEKCETYISEKKAKYVLEINKNEFQGSVGDQAEFDY